MQINAGARVETTPHGAKKRRQFRGKAASRHAQKRR